MKFFFLLSSFLLFSLSFTEDPSPSSPLDYIFTGDCPPEYDSCLPYSNLSFKKDLSSFSEKEILKKMNDFQQKHPEVFLKPLEIYKIDKKSRNFGLRTLKMLNKSETYLNISIDYVISNNEINYEVMFPGLKLEKFPKLPNFNDSRSFLHEKSSFQTECFRFITNFLFHMYHLNDSLIGDSLLGLPLNFNDAPIMSLIPPEITHFRSLDIGRTVLIFRRDASEAFKYYNSALERFWTKSERKLFFNNRLNINLDDFIYAFYIMRTRASFAKEKKIALIPILCMAKINDNIIKDDDERNIGDLVDFHYKLNWNPKKNNLEGIEAVTEAAYEINQTLYLNYKTGSTLELFLFYGIIPKENPNDCFEHEFFNEETFSSFKELKLSLGKCLRIIDLKRVYLVGNLLNMDSQTYYECLSKIEKNNMNPKEFFDNLDKKCDHPKWKKKQNPWIFGINRLEEFQDQLEAMRISSLDYTNYRINKNLPFENGKLLGEYLEKILNFTRQYFKQIEQLKKYGKQKQKEKNIRKKIDL